MKRIIKVLFIGGGVFLAILFIAGIYLFSKLPSKREIQSFLQSSAVPQKPLPATNTTAPTNSKVLPKSAIPITQSPSPAPVADAAKRQETDAKVDKLLRKMLREDISQVQICERLDNAAKFTPQEDPEAIIYEAIDDIDDKNPHMASLKIPVRIILQHPPIKSLVQEMLELPKGQDETTLQKIGFYGRALDAYKYLMDNRRELEQLSDRAYHLYLIGKAVQKRPELAADARTQDFCRQMQQHLLTVEVPQHLKEERAEVLKFLEYAKLSPSEIGFNPESWTKLNFDVDLKNRTFQFGSGQSK